MNTNKDLKKWIKSTTTSPLGRRLSHHHSLLSSYGTQYNKEREDFSDRMWHNHHNMTSIALLNKKSLTRWLTSIVVLLPKDIGRPKIHRLRIINTYEYEYNLVLKYFWPKQGTHKAESNQWLGNNQTGGRSCHSYPKLHILVIV